MKIDRKIIAILLFCTASVAAIHAGETAPAEAEKAEKDKSLSVSEIVDRTNYTAYYQGADGRADVRMTIIDAGKNKRKRVFTILRYDLPNPKDKGKPKPTTPAEVLKRDRANTGEQKFYVYFRQPADVNKMSFLVHKHLDRDDDRWLYLPGLDLVRRIAGSDKRTSFVGSHFFYEDVSGRNVNLDTHELLDKESNKTYYVLKNTPKDSGSVEFAYFKMWIHRKTFVVVQTSYYDRNGKEYRRFNALAVKKIDGYPTVVKSQMTDLRDGSYTLLEYDDVKYNSGIPEDVFTERYLRNPPMKFLK